MYKRSVDAVNNRESANSLFNINARKIQEISNFVDAMRVDTETNAPGTSGDQQKQQRSEVMVPGFGEAQERAEKAVIDAEKFKAAIAEPGRTLSNSIMENAMSTIQTEVSRALGQGKSDDDFFHLMCHIDNNLIGKMERDEYVELEKLLPKMRG